MLFEVKFHGKLDNKRKWIGFKCRLCKSSTSRWTTSTYPKTEIYLHHFTCSREKQLVKKYTL